MVLDLPADDELERAGLGWLMGGFPWAHGRTIITTRAGEWVQQGEDSREVSATDLQHCDWCGAGSLTMLKCGKCRLVYAGVLELVRYLGCLPLAIGLASAHARVHGTASAGEFLAALKRVALPRSSVLRCRAARSRSQSRAALAECHRA